jgi:hypothetical protein
MPEPNRPYYPPRAPWYAPAREAGYSALAATRVQKIPTPGNIGLGAFVLGLIVPGFAFILHRRPKIGTALVAIWPILFTLGLAFLGENVGNLLLGLAISLHATSIVHLISPWLREVSAPQRILASFAAVAGLIVFAYVPIQQLTYHNLFMPIVTDQGSVVVRPTHNPAEVRRGTWIVHQTTARSGWGAVRVYEGISFAPVLALPGDTVAFTRAAIQVNGTDLPRQNDMPTEGSMVVPEGHWFVWPRLNVAVNTAGVDAETLRGVMLSQSSVPFDNLRGVPFSRWFHRQQVLTTPP